ncbi:polysaccharide pyruvyl transferase family protein, partial [Sphingomonas sp.]
MTGSTSAATRPISIGLLWHSSNSGNLGVGALTVANQRIAADVARAMGLEPRFVIMQMRDADTPAMALPDSRVLHIDRKSLLSRDGFWREAGEVDCILDIGAGDSFADIYGPRRFFFLWTTKMMAIARRTPLLLSPQTIGPFTRPAYRAAAAAAMKRCDAVVARDAMSR